MCCHMHTFNHVQKMERCWVRVALHRKGESDCGRRGGGRVWLQASFPRVLTSTAFLFCSRGDCIARSPRQVLSWGSPTSDSIHTVDHSPRTCEPAGVGSSPVCVHARGWCVFVWCAFWRTSSTARPGVTTFFLQVKNQIKQF